MDNDKKKKILAIVVTAIISLVASITATLLGVDPAKLTDAVPDSAIEDVINL